LLVVDGGPQTQKSSTELMNAFWHSLVWLEVVPHWLVPVWPCSVIAGWEP
jgi:hypothetical protein